MIYKESDFRQTKAAYDNSLQRTLICGVGVFGDEVYAASASVAIQQVYDRYWVWVRLTKASYGLYYNLVTQHYQMKRVFLKNLSILTVSASPNDGYPV